MTIYTIIRVPFQKIMTRFQEIPNGTIGIVFVNYLSPRTYRALANDIEAKDKRKMSKWASTKCFFSVAMVK